MASYKRTHNRDCVECGVAFLGFANERYCSQRCLWRRSSRRYRSTRARSRSTVEVDRICGWCDKSYRTSRRHGLYCSNSCAAYGSGRAILHVDLKWRRCRQCDLWWCHGLRCPGYEAHRVSLFIAERDLVPRECASCGEAFMPMRPSGYFADFCSDRCRNREARARRRARTRNDVWRSDRTSGQVRRHAIYERDGWRCQLCGTGVDRTLPHDHRLAATLDHILPVSLGGAHAESNLQLAHRACNSAKKDGVWGNGEQLRLAV